MNRQGAGDRPGRRDGPVLALGIETSCDETAVAVVAADGRTHGEAVRDQGALHQPSGGVVPEVAARAHMSRLDRLIRDTLRRAGLVPADLDLIAATAGPGLAGGLLVGLATGRALALATGKPFMPVNHLEAHALTARLTGSVAFPFLQLLVSGGHCQLLVARRVGDYDMLGTTLDDAVGEAFDKVAKMAGLGYPGGPAVERAARRGRADRFPLPRPMLGRPGCDFSFSGLKTAVLHCLHDLPPGDFAPADIADLCAGFQAAVGDVLVDRCRNAMDIFRQRHPRDPLPLVVAGGVAANAALGDRLAALCAAQGARLVVPPPRLCTDNGVMIAWAALERWRAGLPPLSPHDPDFLTIRPRPRWPLADLAAPDSQAWRAVSGASRT